MLDSVEQAVVMQTEWKRFLCPPSPQAVMMREVKSVERNAVLDSQAAVEGKALPASGMRGEGGGEERGRKEPAPCPGYLGLFP